MSDWPDHVVRLDDGHIAVEVAALVPAERFRVRTADAELEVRGTRFIVRADNGRLLSVAVERGWIELRRFGEPVLDLHAGEKWERVTTAVTPPAPDTASTPAATEPSPTKLDHAVAPVKSTRPVTKPIDKTSSTPAKQPPANEAASTPAITTTVTPPPAPSANPGEADFRAGWTALRGGNATEATKRFTAACVAARNDTLGEDACFWTAVAAKRAGNAATTRDTLVQFLRRFPTSSRAAEASALLGWTLYDSGDLDQAEAQFRRAANDRVPKVRESAERGLEAIERRRAKR